MNDLVKLGDIAADILGNVGQISVLTHALLAVVIPVRDLNAHEHARDDQRQLERHGNPVLRAEPRRHPIEDHDAPIKQLVPELPRKGK